MVEAAMVLPLFILIVLSLILVMTFYYAGHQRQMQAHDQLLQKFDQVNHVIDLETAEASVTKEIRGGVGTVLHQERKHRIYLLRPAKILMMGEWVSDDT